MGLTIDVAKAVVTSINDATFSKEVTATRAYHPIIDTEEMGTTLYCFVSPLGRREKPGFEDIPQATLNRASKLRYYEVDVLLTQQINTDQNTAVDPLADLADEIADHFDGEPLAGVSGAQVRCVKVDQLVADPDDFRDRRFSGLLRLTLRIIQ